MTLIEREAGAHHKVCGEFLSYEAIAYLEDLGIFAAELGAVPITEVALSGGRAEASHPLPFRALSLSRRRLDEVMLDRAVGAGAEVLRGEAVTRLDVGLNGATAHLGSGIALSGGVVFLASGKHDLRGRSRPPGRQNDLIGLKLHFHLSPRQRRALAGRVEIVMFAGGYGGLEPVEDDLANLCLLVRKSDFASLGRSWSALLDRLCRSSHRFAEHLDGAIPSHDRPLAIAKIPYGMVRREADGIWRLGDQAAVIPSFAGEGMAIALHSAALAADAYLAGTGADEFQKRLACDVRAPVCRATLVSQSMVRKRSQGLLAQGIRLWPEALAHVASLTRLPRHALRLSH
ncbi:hypothetical protein GCM10007276_03270 [Agaricicola taiwanensis]|uniref:Uncharacterized protein n=1 Tax=Agaricicola taiwanensis TaxID=591372 RepID=A0A8J2VMY1_9RHOB|nr:hypothetical protein GCM10007276_03270 [Agaricicola taiwanensis]